MIQRPLAMIAAATLVSVFLASEAVAQSVTMQTAQLEQCQQELDIRGLLGVTERRVNGRTLVRAVYVQRGQTAGVRRLTAVEVARINDCADRKSRRILATRDGYPLHASARNCPTPGPILYRGNLYCFRGR